MSHTYSISSLAFAVTYPLSKPIAAWLNEWQSIPRNVRIDDAIPCDLVNWNKIPDFFDHETSGRVGSQSWRTIFRSTSAQNKIQNTGVRCCYAFQQASASALGTETVDSEHYCTLALTCTVFFHLSIHYIGKCICATFYLVQCIPHKLLPTNCWPGACTSWCVAFLS